jgi:hypothetical protein
MTCIRRQTSRVIVILGLGGKVEALGLTVYTPSLYFWLYRYFRVCCVYDPRSRNQLTNIMTPYTSYSARYTLHD